MPDVRLVTPAAQPDALRVGRISRGSDGASSLREVFGDDGTRFGARRGARLPQRRQTRPLPAPRLRQDAVLHSHAGRLEVERG